MSIVMVWEPTSGELKTPGRYVPRFECDACGQLIDDACMGVVAWVRTGTTSHARDETRPIAVEYFAHKGRCDDALRAGVEVDGAATAWEELITFPLHLGNSMTPSARRGVPIVVATTAHPRGPV